MQKHTMCDFCHCQVDGVAYRAGIYRYHKVCYDVQREKPTTQQHSRVTRPFRLSFFSGDTDLRLMQGRQPWRRVA